MTTSPGGIEVARISVRAVPDTSRLLGDLKADLAEIERRVSINVKASVDAARLTESARSAVAEAQALAGDINVRANVDTSQLSEANSALRQAGNGATGLLGGFSLLGAGAAILGTALIPLTAVVAGLAAALVAPLAITAGGVTLFGFIAGFAVKDALNMQKQISTLDTKLSSLKKGTAEYAQVQADLHAAIASEPPAYRNFNNALITLKGALNNLGPRLVLKPLTDGMKLLAAVLPSLVPIVKVVSRFLDGLVTSLTGVVRSDGFKGFVKAFAHDLGKDLKAFGSIAGNIFVGLAGLFGFLNDTLSGGVLKGLENLSGKFADFGKSAGENKGLKSFVDYVKQNMPKVGKLVAGVFGLIGQVFGTLAPIASGALGILDTLLGVLKKLGDVVGPLAATLAALGIGSFFGGPEVGLAAAAVVLLVGAFKQLYDRSGPLRRVIHDIGDYFQQTWLPLIKNAAKQILPAFKGAVKDITGTIRDNKGLFEVLGKAIAALGSAVVIGAILALVGIIRGLGKAFQFSVGYVKFFANVILVGFRVIVAGAGFVVKAVLAIFGAIVDGAAAAFGWIPGIGGKVKAAQDAFHHFADAVNGNISGVGATLKRLQDQINGVGDSHPRFRIDSNTLDEIAHMHELQQLQIADKRFKITAVIEQQIERTPGPGGGMQRPSGLSGSGSGAGAGPGPLVHIDNASFVDTNDVVRKSNRRLRARAGGGVLFPPALIPAGG